MPKFAHLPLLLKPDGKGKLSKRDSDKHGFPLFPLNWKDQVDGQVLTGFKEAGYLPSALVNFLAFLGWNPGTEQELFSLDGLIDAFSLEGINKAGARFDIEKAKWFNSQYIRSEPDGLLAKYVLEGATNEGLNCDNEYAQKVAGLLKPRVVFPQDLFNDARYLFTAPIEYDEKVVKKRWTEEVATVFGSYALALKKTDNISADKAKKTLEEILTDMGVGAGKVMQVLRVAITGEGSGPELMEIISLLGGNETAKRIETAISKLG